MLSYCGGYSWANLSLDFESTTQMCARQSAILPTCLLPLLANQECMCAFESFFFRPQAGKGYVKIRVSDTEGGGYDVSSYVAGEDTRILPA